jgi:hypothetical protein
MLFHHLPFPMIQECTMIASTNIDVNRNRDITIAIYYNYY